ncbi:MAG: hypothetical protein QGI21_04435 [Candidatus Poseidoniaceae archaeon]|nr:hypothetical protein [Candidatus Poseidoniaceae archaeon]
MIPIALYGAIDSELERFYLELPALVDNAYEDKKYQKTLFSISGNDMVEHLKKADAWANEDPFVWPEEIAIEVDMTLQTIKYPDVGLLEHLLTLENIDCIRVSTWMHFATNVYPIYTKLACEGLGKLGLKTPFKPNDIASYGLYVERIEGLKIHAPAAGMPEIGLPRARILQLGLERFE